MEGRIQFYSTVCVYQKKKGPSSFLPVLNNINRNMCHPFPSSTNPCHGIKRLSINFRNLLKTKDFMFEIQRNCATLLQL